MKLILVGNETLFVGLSAQKNYSDTTNHYFLKGPSDLPSYDASLSLQSTFEKAL